MDDAASRNEKSTRIPIGKGIPVPSGKENVRPPLQGIGRKTVYRKTARVLCDENGNQKRVCSARASVQCPLDKKTPFHVHCDDQSIPPSSEAEGPKGDSEKNKKFVPSKIPRPSRVNVVPSLQVEPRAVSKHRNESDARKPANLVENSGIECDDVDERNRCLIDTPKVTREIAEKLDALAAPFEIDACFLKSTSLEEADKFDRCCVLKTVVERDKYQLAELDRIERTKPTSNVKQRDSFSSQLLYPADYRDDLLIIESERDIRSPRLSSDFLKKHINAEQRRLVVNFLLHLGTHCRYSTHAVYESVKLFDVVMDKMSVDTAFIQMSALASLWIILKKQQNFDDIPTATTMVSYAKELYAGREDLLKEYERKILQALNFNLTFADPYSMLAHHLNRLWSYLHLSDQTMTFLYNCGCYLIDITLLDEHFCRMYANLLVLTVTELVLGLVLDTVVVDASPRWLFWRSLIISDAAHLIGWFREEEIDRTRVKILQCLLDSRKKLYNVVYKKYSRTRHGRVAKSFFERATNLSIAETFHDT